MRNFWGGYEGPRIDPRNFDSWSIRGEFYKDDKQSSTTPLPPCEFHFYRRYGHLKKHSSSYDLERLDGQIGDEAAPRFREKDEADRVGRDLQLGASFSLFRKDFDARGKVEFEAKSTSCMTFAAS